MTVDKLVWAAPEWTTPVAWIAAAVVALVLWAYWRAPAGGGVRLASALLKTLAFAALLLCLLEPLFSGTRPRAGANLFVVLADNSQSMQIRDRGARSSRGQEMRDALNSEQPWQTRLSQDFDVRRYAFDSRLTALTEYSSLAFDGTGSALGQSLKSIGQRFQGRPLAGVLLLTDGNSTDALSDVDWQQLPPIYPVLTGRGGPARDVRLERITVSQTNFEAAPVTIQAEIAAHGYQGRSLQVELLDQAGQIVDQQTIDGPSSDDTQNVRFQARPDKAGVSFYRVRAFDVRERDQGEDLEDSPEATLENNSRLAVVDRGQGPYRILYVSGRPNWEFKFLRRALTADSEVELVGLVRIAKREAKFEFRGRGGDSSNPFFRGFDSGDAEDRLQYDQPVLVRIDTTDKTELREGFPKSADQLYRYHALILDDLEADFFTEDQMTLVQKFVSQRGGGLMMLGGQESLEQGNYQRTSLGDLLPVYLDRLAPADAVQDWQFTLTREGWLQPWTRLRSTEDAEQLRLRDMPAFRTMNRVGAVKPGATILAEARGAEGQRYPALVTQRYGKGRTAAVLVGDFWRWAMRRETDAPHDLERAWRQTLRWLVAEVPDRVQVETPARPEEPGRPIEVRVTVRDELYEPLDNARVTVQVQAPDGGTLELTAEAADDEPGVYQARYVPRQTGGYFGDVQVAAPDGSDVGSKQVGWVAEPAAEEFARLEPDESSMRELAERTGGEVIGLNDIDEFVESLPNRRVPITEPWLYPVWHQPLVFLFALCCLVAECGLRRWKGLP